MPYLFTSPFRKETVVLAGQSLVYSYNVASTVYKTVGGQWIAEETPATETLLAAARILSGSGSQTIDDATAAELIAAGVGTCTQL